MNMATRAAGQAASNHWFMNCAMTGALLVGAAHVTRAADDDPRVWLEKMNNALATRNYDGIFMHISGSRVETMRIVHRIKGGQLTERLASMDGSGREFVRTNDALTCYLPDRKTILVESRQARDPFLGSLPQFGKGVDEFYEISALPNARLLGRPVRVIAVKPKDPFRFGYQLWLDEKSAMPLKTQLCDARGATIEQIVFAKLDTPERIADSELAPAVHTNGMRWVRQDQGESRASELAAFRATHLPPGFRMTVSGSQTIGGGNVPASHTVYSDGVATVSVFVEADPNSRRTSGPAPNADQTAVDGAAPPHGGGPAVHETVRVGSGYLYTRLVDGHQVTVVGEVPAQTVEYIGESVKAESVNGVSLDTGSVKALSGGESTQH